MSDEKKAKKGSEMDLPEGVQVLDDMTLDQVMDKIREVRAKGHTPVELWLGSGDGGRELNIKMFCRDKALTTGMILNGLAMLYKSMQDNPEQFMAALRERTGQDAPKPEKRNPLKGLV